jgi:hypothetical protein
VPRWQRERYLPTNYLEYNCRDSFDHCVVILSDGQENGHTVNYPVAMILRIKEMPKDLDQ